MALRETKKKIPVKLSPENKKQFDNFLQIWSFEEKVFVRSVFRAYLEDRYPSRKPYFWEKFIKRKKDFEFLSHPDKFKNWQERFSATGEKNARRAYAKLLRKELDFAGLAYLLAALDKEISDAVVPEEMIELFRKTFLVHLKKEAMSEIEKGAPKRPFILVIGPTGSGKTHTIKAAIERAIFQNELTVQKDYGEEKEKISEKHPWLTGVSFLRWFKPLKELAVLEEEEELRNSIARYRWLAKSRIFRKQVQKKLVELEKRLGEIEKEEESIQVDYQTISPDAVQTMWYGETGNKFSQAMGSPNVPSIRHVLEAHGVLVDPSRMREDDVQAKTLSATVNKIMDEITDGIRECIFVADTHSPETIAKDTYRRFDELGVVLDISKFWRDKKYLKLLIELEARRHNIYVAEELLRQITGKVYNIFVNKSLVITPAYVRKLVSSLIEQKGDLKPEYFDDERLVRNCFENVAMNSHGELYKKVVKKFRRQEGYLWDDYQGSVKEDYLEKVTSALFYGGRDKGVVLVGPPGSGKTFLPQVLAATHPEITYISAKIDDLSDEYQPIEAIIRNLNGLYAIGKMLAPALIVINEADAVTKQRNEQMPSPYDRVTNKFLDLLDGEESVKGTFTTLTTNFYEGLDKAVTRPGRLDVMLVEGKLVERDIYKIIKREMGDEPVSGEITEHEIYAAAKTISNVPAGYVDFVRKLKDLRSMDFNIVQVFKKMFEAGEKDSDKFEEFIKFNAKTILMVLQTLEEVSDLASRAKKDARVLIENKALIYDLLRDINQNQDYLLRKSHLTNAKTELLKDPKKKALKGLDEFLSAEMSLEPQVGKIVGAAYGDNIGLLVPINTNLIFKPDAGEDIIVTGVTKGSVLQNVDFTEMTFQSAREALTLNIHYFQNLLSERGNYKHLDAAIVIGSLLKNRSIHHQMESVNYMGGGPSAGFALSINTLSVLLNIPVYHDFGITGAPGTRGVSKDKAGSSVMIGGEDKKAERVLIDLRRMYVPEKNYHNIPLEHQEAYWDDGKIIIPVGDYRDLIPEVLYFEKEHEDNLQKLIACRVAYNKKKMFIPENKLGCEREEIEKIEECLKKIAESEIVRRLISIYNFYRASDRNEFTSLEAIFDEYNPEKKQEMILKI